jgi:hypothetical protein
MTDAVALLAISQLVCLGAICYLYTQLQAVKSANPIRKRPPSARVQRMVAPTEIGSPATARAAHAAYGVNSPARAPAAAPSTLAARIGESGIDIAALARRMRKSEEEVRLLLRRQGIAG